ncbi:MAG: hypothetical protein ACPGRW_06155 [Flavobacteriaceae bacterium]
MIVNDACGGSTAPYLNTGGKNQCTPKPIRSYALAKTNFSFASVAASKTKAAWDTAKENKDIVIFWDIEEFAQNNTEATKKEGRFADYPLKAGVRGLNVTHYLSDCSYNALESYSDSTDYTRIFRILTDENFTAIVNEDGSVQGEPVSNFSVGVLTDATDETPQNTEVQIKFANNTKSNIKPEFDLITYEGIYGVDLEVGTTSGTEIKVKALAGCSGTAITSLEDGDFVVKDSGGGTESISFTAADADGYYTLTGTGFVTGHTVELAGVVVKSNVMYEDSGVVAITV